MQNFTTQHSDYSHTLFYKIVDILFFWHPFFIVKVKALVAQLCPTLCNPMDCGSIGFSVHGSPQARILEWVAIAFSRGSSRPRDQTHVSRFAGRFFTI